MFKELPFPFHDNEFPADLGAVVMRTVLDGQRPGLHVAHFPDGGGWAAGDGVGDPNEPGAVIATHIWHAIEKDSRIREVASLPPGQQANRSELSPARLGCSALSSRCHDPPDSAGLIAPQRSVL